MKWPGKDNIELAPQQEGGFTLPPEGRYNVIVTNATVRDVRGGAFLSFENTIADGTHAGVKFVDEFWISNDGQKMGTTFAKLGTIFERAAWWPPLKDGEEIEPKSFALMIPLDKLRYSVDTIHEYSIKAYLDVDSYKDYSQKSPVETVECPYQKWLRCDKSVYEEWSGQKWSKLIVRPAFGADIQEVYLKSGEESVKSVAEEAAITPDDLPF